MSEPALSDWVGRTQQRTGVLTPDLAGMLDAAVSHAASAGVDLSVGAPMPLLWHWVAFPEFVPLSQLGRDGHPKLGGFLPPVPLERRMWAGGKLSFSGRFHIGEELNKRSEIEAVDEKTGSTGTMVFVRVRHHVTGAQGGAIEEQQDIVYLAIPESFKPPKAIPSITDPDFEELVPVNEARLFRYSAATYNAHRIHYDWPYTRDIEKYPGLVVHGPMQATFLMEAAIRHRGALPARFRFRGVHPMFHQDDVRLLGKAVEGENATDLCTAVAGGSGGHQGMQARIEWGD
jgi:3-methylfumaryl-CoA hydratase